MMGHVTIDEKGPIAVIIWDKEERGISGNPHRSRVRRSVNPFDILFTRLPAG